MVLKIAMVSPYFVRCGIATYTEQLNSALAKYDCEVYGVRLPRFGHKTSATYTNVIRSILTAKVDLIHVQHEYGLYVLFDEAFYAELKTLGKPIVTTLHAVGNWELDPKIVHISDQIIVHNQFCFKRLSRMRDENDKITVIPHGATPLESPPPPTEVCKESLNIPREVPVVGYLGYVSPVKRLDFLIEAMVKVPKTALLIGGGWHIEGETNYGLALKRRTLKELPNRCRWLGYVREEDLSRVYSAMDIMVYPSLYATESGALITALSHQKAVIASNIPPFKEKEEVGALITFKTVKDLTRKIKRLLKNPKLKNQLCEGAKQYCIKNSWEQIAKQHINLYEKMA